MRPRAARDADDLPGPVLVAEPAQDVGQIIGEPFTIHKTEARQRARSASCWTAVGLSPEHYNRYPHEFSGGQRQRIGIARALALRPKLIVCDEPVSALDVSIQAQILNLLESLQDEFDLTYVFISHDLSVIRQISDRIAVMYLGRIVELGESEALYEHPRHPYTAALLSAVPRATTNGVGAPPAHRPGRRRALARRAAARLRVPSALPQGAPVDGRSGRARDCRDDLPQLAGSEGEFVAHDAACWHPLTSVDELRSVASS